MWCECHFRCRLPDFMDQKNSMGTTWRYPAIITDRHLYGLKPWTAALGVRDLIESQDPMFPGAVVCSAGILSV